MRILLDESVPVQVRGALVNHSASTVVEMGWRGIGNGELLNRAEAGGFDLLIIADKNRLACNVWRLAERDCKANRR